jgi:hypothetical protein
MRIAEVEALVFIQRFGICETYAVIVVVVFLVDELEIIAWPCTGSNILVAQVIDILFRIVL